MSLIPEFQRGLIALRMGLVSDERLLEAATIWFNELDMQRLLGNPARGLLPLLAEFGDFGAESAASVEAALDADPDALPPVPPRVRRGLMDLRAPAELIGWLAGLPDLLPAADEFRPVPRAERYEMRGEIARGGLGRVVEAVDRHLDRDVAVKLVLDGLAPALRRRFVREARITARLDHPNIVPVHDFDEFPSEGGNATLYLCLKRVRGRDLGSLLAAIRRGEPGARRWSRARLLAVFQGICLGVAYAHSKGVLHRDLKPANVMIGDFGETLIIDWGLARDMGRTEPGAPAIDLPPAAAADLTMEGDLIGTPQYMSPEQAAGRIADLDARSDVYSLGGILYTILTHRPPFPGETRGQVLSEVLSGRIARPSHVVEDARSSASAAGLPLAGIEALPEYVPPDLEAICLKALAHRREDRYPGALELHGDIQLFLEGVKDRERNHRRAEELASRARAAVDRQERLGKEAKEAHASALRLNEQVLPRGDKTALWTAEDRAKRLEREALEAFNEASAHLASAIAHEPENAAARDLTAELHWKRFLEAEEAEDEAGMLVNRAVVERFDDGRYATRLKGDGALTLRTRAYRCRCLLDGRAVEARELDWLGYHPCSGRSLDGGSGDGLGELESVLPPLVRVHGERCVAEDIAGAGAWLFRYEEEGRRLIPVTPRIAGEGEVPIPAGVVDGAFEAASPYRPRGNGVWVGRTPILRRSLPMGSWLALVWMEGRAPLRIPFRIGRCGEWVQEATLYFPDEIPPGFVPVAAGEFGFQGGGTRDEGEPLRLIVHGDFFMGRHPVTCGDYGGFLNDLAGTDVAQAARRVPREAESAGAAWPGPPYFVAPPPLPIQNRLVAWETSWPAIGISWEDAMSYAAWWRRRHGWLATLPHEISWEKSGRGPDRRTYPWGAHWNEVWENGYWSLADGMGPVRVEEFAGDESPYGVRGLAGNTRDLCLNEPGPHDRGWRACRGGTWQDSAVHSRLQARGGLRRTDVRWSAGLRLAAPCRVPEGFGETKGSQVR